LRALPTALVDALGLAVGFGAHRADAVLHSGAALNENALRASLAFLPRLREETATLTSCFLLGSGRLRPREREQ
jgi:hypothetical protein